MNKELEALKRLRDGYENNYYKQFTSSTAKINEDYNMVLKTLTPPTADEVCEYLISFYGRKVVYDNTKSNHVFYFEESKTIIVKLYCDGYINFATGDYHYTNNLPPHLITLIGSFYEGVEK